VTNAYKYDLAILVADKNMQSAVQGILSRPKDISIRPITSNVYIHIQRDPGCFLTSHDFLRPMLLDYAHCLVIFDRIGSGQEQKSRSELEEIVENKLSANGWSDRAKAITIDPELEVWIWSDSPEVDRCIGWQLQKLDLRSWLNEKGLWPQDSIKPSDPKKSFEKILREIKKPRSSAIYEKIAKSVSFEGCTDPAFKKFINTMQEWFAVG
jgi:hypothetical protein